MTLGRGSEGGGGGLTVESSAGSLPQSVRQDLVHMGPEDLHGARAAVGLDGVLQDAPLAGGVIDAAEPQARGDRGGGGAAFGGRGGGPPHPRAQGHGEVRLEGDLRVGRSGGSGLRVEQSSQPTGPTGSGFTPWHCRMVQRAP